MEAANVIEDPHVIQYILLLDATQVIGATKAILGYSGHNIQRNFWQHLENSSRKAIQDIEVLSHSVLEAIQAIEATQGIGLTKFFKAVRTLKV